LGGWVWLKQGECADGLPPLLWPQGELQQMRSQLAERASVQGGQLLEPAPSLPAGTAAVADSLAQLDSLVGPCRAVGRVACGVGWAVGRGGVQGPGGGEGLRLSLPLLPLPAAAALCSLLPAAGLAGLLLGALARCAAAQQSCSTLAAPPPPRRRWRT
jgi:hypothetical protein